MSYDARFIVVALAAFAVANLACCALVPWMWRRRSTSSFVRAEDLRHLRLLPAVVAAVSMTLASLSYAFFEQRGHEEIGMVMTSLAALSVTLAAVGAGRLAWLWLVSRRTVRTWTHGAESVSLAGWSRPAFVVDTAFPIVAVVGIWRPKLIVARPVLEQCPADELAAILAHERAHVDRRDNFARLLFAATPDLLSWLPVSKRIATAWHDAAEESADESTVSLGERGRLLLAQALLRVARMVPTGASPATMPASALYRGENIERRVRRLLAPVEPVTVRWTRPQRRLIRGAVMAGCVLALEAVHNVVEAAVTHLP